MSLLLLFLPHTSTPPSNQSAFTQAVIFSIETIRPNIDYVQNLKPAVVFSIDTTKPTLEIVQKALGVFQDSTTQYSSATVTYNSGLYGGMDRMQVVASDISSIDSVRPTIDTIEKF